VKATAQIFLSYAREDEEKVENLYQKLSDARFKPWMDTKDILPGERWKSSIQKAIRRSDFFLACLSANSVNKRGFLQKEIKDALDIWQEMLDSDIYLIPVRLEDCEVPESLCEFQWVDLLEEDGWTQLVKAIQVGMERRAGVPANEEPSPGTGMATLEEGPERVRVLIIDNDPRVRLDLQALLELQGYWARIVQGVGQALLEQAVTDAWVFRPHVAIVDLRLLDDYSDERSGLELIRSLRSARCILYSAYLSPEVTREALSRYGATSWVSKGEPTQRLLDEVGKAAQGSCASHRDLALRQASAWTPQRIVEILFGRDTDVPPDIVRDVLGRLFPENAKIKLETVGGEVANSLSVSRGRSFVCKAWPDDLEPVVVKLAPAEQIQSEAENYRKHIQGRLVGQFYAHLEQTIGFWDLGGTVYRFMGSSLRKLPSFTTFYQEKTEPAIILKPLNHFFTEVWSRHYRSSQHEDLSLFRVYDQALNLEERLKRFSNQERRRAFPGLPISLINPVPWVLRHAGDSLIPGARQAITHGDLHGDNLFADGEHAWAIDFERTGPGHILRDFVELEVDIVTRLLPDEVGLSLLYELALVLVEPPEPTAPFRQTKKLLANPETRKALDVIAGLRKLAYEMTRYPDSREYLWGLLLDALFVATIVSEESPQRERALLLGAVLCGRLQHWGKERPTKTPRSGPRFDVFLSYQRTDQKAVKYLARRLREAGLQAWLDRWNLIPGEPWQEAVEEALDQSRTCAVFWGPRGLGPWQNEEMRAALERRVRERSHRVIPVLLPGCPEPEEAKLPHFLKRVTWVDFREGLDDSNAFKNLVAGIRGIAPGPDSDSV
jgi:DNA-binding NarL/FixJ family response regulator